MRDRERERAHSVEIARERELSVEIAREKGRRGVLVYSKGAE